MRVTGHTKDGEVQVDIVTPQDVLKDDISKATTIEQRLTAIEKYLGAR